MDDTSDSQTALAHRLAEAERRAASAEARARRAESLAHEAQDEVERLQRALKGVWTSRSWVLTAPVRASAEVLRRVLGRDPTASPGEHLRVAVRRQPALSADQRARIDAEAKLRISIVTVCRNAAATIETTLESIRRQTYRNIDHVVIDGASTDATLEILDRYRDQITYFVSERDGGIFDAMNKGVRAASGDVVFFLNADDWFVDDGVLTDVVAAFEQNPDAQMIFGDQIFDIAGRRVQKLQRFENVRNYLAKTTIQHQTLFTRRNVFTRVGEFPLQYKVVGDYDWILRAFVQHELPYAHIDRVISIMATEGNSWGVYFEGERYASMRPLYSNFEILWRRVIPFHAQWVKRRVVQRLKALR